MPEPEAASRRIRYGERIGGPCKAGPGAPPPPRYIARMSEPHPDPAPDRADPALQPIDILIAPHPSLRAEGRPVRPEDRALLRALLPRMFADHVSPRPGSGWPRRRSGVELRLAIVDLMEDDVRRRSRWSTRRSSGQRRLATREEGCLSLPGQYAEVARPARVRVRYTDLDGAGTRSTPRAARRLPAARDRPSRRRAVRRPPVRAEAQHDPAPAGQGAEAEGAGAAG